MSYYGYNHYGHYGYKTKYNNNNDFEITKREVLFSVIIVSIMLLIGVIIHGKINDSLMLEYQKYNTALQIENDSDLFAYGMKTNIGNAFVYGDLEAVDTVTYSEIDGKYMYIEKVKEKYTRHTRTVTYTDSKGKTRTRTEVYWTWDYAGSENKKCKEISFCEIVFDSNKINLPSSNYIDTIKESSRIRYKYYGVKSKYTGTIFTELKDNTICDNTSFYNNCTIKETIEELESGFELVAFWMIWIVLTSGCVVLFCYFDNKWLEDK